MASKLITRLAALALLAQGLTGCGVRAYTNVPDPAASTAALTTAAPITPLPQAELTNKLVSVTTTTPAPILVDMKALLTAKTNGSFLGLGAYKCTVQVTNPSSVARAGTLTVTFMDGSKQSATAPASQAITLAPAQTQSFDFSDPKWSTNDVQIQLVTTPYQAAATTAPAATAAGAGVPTTSY